MSFTSVFFVAVIAFLSCRFLARRDLPGLPGGVLEEISHPCAPGFGMICYDDGYEKYIRMLAIENVRSKAATLMIKLFTKLIRFLSLPLALEGS
ncbi:hypothetical protein [Paenibacillus prosopidis]|uniref:hypothetical protein n=1 Tax=Paenibacillus prosopidis TaxID=630520 RepID=UPI000DF4068D|nr:hypothetical protein [Paenibacillus prosopidis]